VSKFAPARAPSDHASALIPLPAGLPDARLVESAALGCAAAVLLAAPAMVALPLAVLTLLWCSARLLRRARRPAPLDAAALTLTLATALGYLLSPTPAGAARLAGLAVALALYLAATQLVGDERAAARGALIALGLLMVCIAVEVVLLRGAYPPPALTPGRVTAALERLPDLRGDPLDMNARLVIHAYGIAQLALLGLALCAAWAFHGSEGWARRLAVAGALGFALLLALSQSRSALLAAVVVIPVVGAFRSRRWWLALPAGALLILLVNALGLLARSADSDWLSLRRYAWSGALRLLLEQPFTGVGPGMRTVAERFAAHFELADPHTISHAHNVFLQTYLELGPLGFAGLVGLFGFGLLAAGRAGRAQTREARIVASAVAAALAGSLLFGLTDAVPTSDVGLALLLLLGALLGPLAPAGGLWRPGATVRLASLAGLGLALASLAVAWPRAVSAFEVNRAASLLSGDAPVAASEATRAVAAASLAVDLRPGDPIGYRELAWARIGAGDVAGALAALDTARKLPGLSGYEAFQLGRVYEALGQTADMVPLWVQAGEGWRLMDRAADRVSKRDYDEAELIYRGLITADPDNADALGELGVLLLRRRGDADEALRLLGQAVALDPRKRDPLADYLLSRGVSRRGAAQRGETSFDDALAWLRAAAALQPDRARPHLELGRALALAGQPGAARSELLRALELEPSNQDAQRVLGQLAG